MLTDALCESVMTPLGVVLENPRLPSRRDVVQSESSDPPFDIILALYYWCQSFARVQRMRRDL